MKDEKGFTLVELIIVMLLITIITFAAYPNFANLSTKAKEKYDAGTRLLLKSAASMYVNNNIDEVNNILNSSSKLCIPVGKLIAYEYLDSDFKDSNNNEINPRKCINVTRTNSSGNIRYNYDVTTTDVIASTVDYLPPVITIKSKGSVECKKVMNVASVADFNSKCTVSATDNGSPISLPAPRQSIGRDPRKIFLEYNATDASGNKAVPLTIELIIG